MTFNFVLKCLPEVANNFLIHVIDILVLNFWCFSVLVSNLLPMCQIIKSGADCNMSLYVNEEYFVT